MCHLAPHSPPQAWFALGCYGNPSRACVGLICRVVTACRCEILPGNPGAGESMGKCKAQVQTPAPKTERFLSSETTETLKHQEMLQPQETVRTVTQRGPSCHLLSRSSSKAYQRAHAPPPPSLTPRLESRSAFSLFLKMSWGGEREAGEGKLGKWHHHACSDFCTSCPLFTAPIWLVHLFKCCVTGTANIKQNKIPPNHSSSFMPGMYLVQRC